jgi:aspartate aminotransferase-like enzyme
MAEGINEAWARHAECAKLCRNMGREIGLRLFPKNEEICSPTVTAFCVPEGWTWPELDAAFRARGLVVGGNYGQLAGKVFRIGHMGIQAKRELVENGMQIIAEVLNTKH